MLKTLLVLPDGREISSGIGANQAVQSFTVTQCVNEETELAVGSVCAAMVEVRLLTPGGGLAIGAGEEVAVYRVDQAGQRIKLGLFIAQKPTRPSANTMVLTAYDFVTKLDRDVGGWLESLNGWPYSLLDFARLVCAQCGVELKNEDIPNAGLPVQKFSPGAVTGRQLIRWVGQLAGRFCRATPDGQLEFSWYTPRTDVSIGPSYIPGSEIFVEQTQEDLSIRGENVVCAALQQDLHITSPQMAADAKGEDLGIYLSEYNARQYYYQNSLAFADYQVTAVEKVHLRQTPTDVGTVYPDELPSANTYCITGNPLLTGADAAWRLRIAEGLYQQLKSVTYTPCKVELPAGWEIYPGDVVGVTDKNGRRFSLYVMTKTQRGQRDILECTGSHRRDTSDAVNSSRVSGLEGKVLELQMDMNGLRLENTNGEKQMTSLQLTVDGIESKVTAQQNQLDAAQSQITTLRQDAQAVDIAIRKIYTDGVSRVETTTGYTFGAEGLRIRKSGEEMENLLDNTGMYVTRSGETVLQANNAGVVATDVQVRNYLTLGDHARLEDYGLGRTGCFYI